MPYRKTLTLSARERRVGDRMRLAMMDSRYRVRDMAEYFGVDRTTVSSWLNNHIYPRTDTLRLWGIRCDVSYEWLVNGQDAQADREATA